jgi:hypothetical protein
MFWNQFVVFHRPEDEDFLRDPRLIEMRRAFVAELNTMADAGAKGHVQTCSRQKFFRRSYSRPSPLRGVRSKYDKSLRRVKGHRFKPEQ